MSFTEILSQQYFLVMFSLTEAYSGINKLDKLNEEEIVMIANKYKHPFQEEKQDFVQTNKLLGVIDGPGFDLWMEKVTKCMFRLIIFGGIPFMLVVLYQFITT